MVTAALGAVGGFLARPQSHPQRAERPPMPVSYVPPATTKAERKAAKLALANAREERLFYLLSQPEVIGLVTVFAGLFAANKIPFSPDPPSNAALQGLAATTAILMGLGHAGVGDTTTLSMATIGGTATFVGGLAGAEPDWLKKTNDILRKIADLFSY